MYKDITKLKTSIKTVRTMKEIEEGKNEKARKK